MIKRQMSKHQTRYGKDIEGSRGENKVAGRGGGCTYKEHGGEWEKDRLDATRKSVEMRGWRGKWPIKAKE